MSLIAEEAGVGLGTIYNYFVSKKELVNALSKRRSILKIQERDVSPTEFFRLTILNYFNSHPKEF